MIDIKEYLEAEIKTRLESIVGDINITGDILLGKKEERIEPLEMQGSLLVYRQLAELNVILSVYVANFNDERIKTLQRKTEATLKRTEKELYGIISKIIERMP